MLLLRFSPLLLALGLVGCAVPVATGLADEDANQVVVALERNGVAAHKEADPDSEARFRVTVGREDASAAVGILSQENLPQSKAPGVLDALGESSIVPSRTAEHAKLVRGMAGDLERSLRAIDGVLSARVHLAVPEEDLLNDVEKPRPPTASVLLRYRGPTPPLASGEVQRLVAGAVPGLSPDQVSVVASSTAAPVRLPERELSRLGPVTVTRASMLPLKLMLGGVALLNLLLLGLMIALWTRMRKAQVALLETRSAIEAKEAR
jgi:type III secretion protein J